MNQTQLTLDIYVGFLTSSLEVRFLLLPFHEFISRSAIGISIIYPLFDLIFQAVIDLSYMKMDFTFQLISFH